MKFGGMASGQIWKQARSGNLDSDREIRGKNGIGSGT